MKAFANKLVNILHKRNGFIFATLVVLGLAMCCSNAIAQSGAGSIQGTVTDLTGAVIPGATITATQVDTGVTMTTKTNAAGFYILPGLFTGTYTVIVDKSGFQSFSQQIQLQVAQTAQVDLHLSAGNVNSKVEVRAEDIQLVTTDSGTLSSTLENDRINQLPMNGRQMLTLAQLTTPGLEGGGQRANGNMSEALEYVQDGVPVMNRNFGSANVSNFAQFPDPDAIQEVKIEMAASNAQFSSPATGIITTKSGTNRLHGSAFETARNNAFGVAEGRGFGTTGVLPHLVRNEFGVNLGGPIRIPFLYDGRDKSFFFFAFERYSLRQNSPQLIAVPTQAMRNGDFSGLVDSSGGLQTLYDPNTTLTASGNYQRQKFLGNIIPSGRQSPLSRLLNIITPLPSTTDNPLVRGNLYIPAPNNYTVPNTTFRLDHTFTEKNRAFLRYTDIRQSSVMLRTPPPTLAYQGFPAGASGYQLVPVSSVSAATGFTHLFSNSFFSETVLGMQWFNQQVTGGGNVNLNYETMMGLPNNFGETGFPQISGPVVTYTGTQFNYGQAQIVTNMDENLTKVFTRHKLQFGFRFRHERFGYLPDRRNDSIQFGNLATGDYNTASGSNYTPLANTGNANGDFYLGAANSYTVNLSTPYVHFSDNEFDTYVQDNWKLLPTLTLDVGLRWEAHPAVRTDGLVQAFDLPNKAVVMQYPIQHYVDVGYTVQGVITNLTNLGVRFETPEQAGLPQSIFKNHLATFSPRIGLAWAPRGSRGTVLRAGYGRYIYPVPTRNSVATSVVGNEPFTASYATSYSLAAQSPDGKANYLLRSQQSVVAGQNSSNVINSSGPSALLPGQIFTTMNPNHAPQYVTQVAVTAEQPLPLSSVLRVTYLYDHGNNLDQAHRYNAQPSAWLYESTTGNPTPTGTYASVALGPYDQTTYGNNVQINSTGYSNDNALQVNYQRLYKKGYAFQLFYVYSSVFRVGGNSTRDSFIYPKEDFLPSLLKGTDYKSLNRQQNYIRDTAIPRHHIGFNGVVDLPVGKDKMFFGHMNSFWNQVFGGYQIAAAGNITSQSFGVAATNWGPTSSLHVYRHGHKVRDCRSGTCYDAYQWFNGYLSPKVINATTNGVIGIASDYTPYQVPINNDPSVTSLFGTNNVTVHLNNGSNVVAAYNPGPAGVNPYSHTILSGPIAWSADASLFKVFLIKDSVNLRVNVDAFNVFNIQGYNNPSGTDGIEAIQSPHNTPRQLQLTARITF